MPTSYAVTPGSNVKAELGRGSYGYPVPAWDAKEGRLVAMKRQDTDSDDAVREMVFFHTMASARSLHLVELFDMFVENRTMTLVFEYMRSNLYQEWSRAQGHLDDDTCHRYSTHMLIAFQCMHEYKIVRRDVSMQNCLLDARSNVLKLCDLGLSACAVDFVCDRIVCTAPYRPPEICLAQAGALATPGEAIDLWSAGCIISAFFGAVFLFRVPEKQGHRDSSQEIFGQQVALLGDPTAAWPDIKKTFYWSSYSAGLALQKTSPKQLLCEKARLVRPLADGIASLVLQMLQWGPSKRLSASAALAQFNASQPLETSAVAAKILPGVSAGSQGECQPLEAPGAVVVIPPGVSAGGQDKLACAKTAKCKCPHNCGEISCWKARRAKYSSTPSPTAETGCRETPLEGFDYCKFCKCEMAGRGTPKCVDGFWCKKHQPSPAL